MPLVPSSADASLVIATAFVASPTGIVQIAARRSLRMVTNDFPSGETPRPV